jgi:23S rRNA (pseudouridine1915-N3)-methyltransferase
MKIKIICIGKIKEKYIEDFISEYTKRLGAFCNLNILEFKEIPPSKTFPKERSIKEEGEIILKNISTDDFVIAMDEKGKEFSSIEFSKIIKTHNDVGVTLCFIIGGPYGLCDEVRSRANSIISLSKMTFTHNMARIFLIEQIYRGFCIISGKEYHN